jgi:hypothetical protein
MSSRVTAGGLMRGLADMRYNEPESFATRIDMIVNQNKHMYLARERYSAHLRCFVAAFRRSS